MNFDFNFKEIFTAFMVLFAVIDIIGNIPIIIDLRKKVGHIQSEKASIIAGVILTVFLFLGQSIPQSLKINNQEWASKFCKKSRPRRHIDKNKITFPKLIF